MPLELMLKPCKTLKLNVPIPFNVTGAEPAEVLLSMVVPKPALLDAVKPLVTTIPFDLMDNPVMLLLKVLMPFKITEFDAEDVLLLMLAPIPTLDNEDNPLVRTGPLRINFQPIQSVVIEDADSV